MSFCETGEGQCADTSLLAAVQRNLHGAGLATSCFSAEPACQSRGVSLLVAVQRNLHGRAVGTSFCGTIVCGQCAGQVSPLAVSQRNLHGRVVGPRGERPMCGAGYVADCCSAEPARQSRGVFLQNYVPRGEGPMRGQELVAGCCSAGPARQSPEGVFLRNYRSYKGRGQCAEQVSTLVASCYSADLLGRVVGRRATGHEGSGQCVEQVMSLTAAQRNLHVRVAGCLSAEIGSMCGPGLVASSGTCMAKSWAGGVSFCGIDCDPARGETNVWTYFLL